MAGGTVDFGLGAHTLMVRAITFCNDARHEISDYVKEYYHPSYTVILHKLAGCSCGGDVYVPLCTLPTI